MTNEEKQLVFKDLCARLPHGVQIHIDFKENGHIVGDATLNTITSITGQIFGFVDFEQDFKNGDCCPVSGFGSNKLLHLEQFKPYLRPMSSMTKEEDDMYWCMNYNPGTKVEHIIFAPKLIDWLNAHHFDYRGLIEKGLALEAPEGMYNLA